MADNALGMLADLARMKAAAANNDDPSSESSDSPEPKKKKGKKGKKTKDTKKGKKGKKDKKEKKPKKEKKEKVAKKLNVPDTDSEKRKSSSSNALDMLANLKKMRAGASNDSDDDDSSKKAKKKKKKRASKRSSLNPPKSDGTHKSAASGALGFLADLAAMKSGKKSTGFVEEEEEEEEGGKEEDLVEEIEEKTPEPPSDLSEIEKRRFLLKYARKKLERRKYQRSLVRKEKAAKDENNALFGKEFIEKFMKEMEREQAFISNKLAEEDEKLALQQQNEENDKKNNLFDGILSDDLKKRQKNDKSLERKPGRVNILSDGDMFDHEFVVEKSVVLCDKICSTDWSMFENYLREEFEDEFKDENGDEQSLQIGVISGLMESTLKFGYPRQLWEIEEDATQSPTAKRIRARQRAEEQRKKTMNAAKERRRRLKQEEKERRRNMPHLNRKKASQLIKNGDFLDNFRKKSKWIERTLGINIEKSENAVDFDVESVDMAMADDESGGGGQRKKKFNYLKLKRSFYCNKFSDRAIGNISFCASNRDWFCATYFIANSKYSYSTATNGCVGIWNFMLPKAPEYELYATNMITSTQFHPTDAFLVFGSTINGQILMWDLRQNDCSKAIKQSNFSAGHCAPVFKMSFLPKTGNVKKSTKQDVEHILSVSNDGKLCIWRTDELSVKPQTECTLKPSDDHATARQIELITTCFDYSSADYSNIVLGSDEGYLYNAELAAKSGPISAQSEDAHYGPITAVEHFPTHHFKLYDFKQNVDNLYLTSSYDWTVKLWNVKRRSMQCLAVFDEMTDYVYDVKWNIGGKPGVFACCDGEGKINLFDIAKDFKHPLLSSMKVSKNKNVAATCLQWTNDGKILACGDSEGNVLFYNVHKSLSTQTLESCEALQFVANKYV